MSSRLHRAQTERDELRTLVARLAQAQEDERQRIARGLHDSLGHTLALAKLKLGRLQAAEGVGGCASAIGSIVALLDEAICEMRALTLELSSPLLEELGLEPAIAGLCDRLAAESAIRFQCATDPRPRPRLTRDLRVLLYRAARELLLNAVKHSQADGVSVCLRRADGQVHILIEDDGVGFDVAAVTAPFAACSGFGLFSIHESVEATGGRIDIESSPGRGTRIALIAPALEEGDRR